MLLTCPKAEFRLLHNTDQPEPPPEGRSVKLISGVRHSVKSRPGQTPDYLKSGMEDVIIPAAIFRSLFIATHVNRRNGCHYLRCDNCSTRRPRAVTAWPPSTSTTWSRSRPSWRRRAKRDPRHRPGQRGARRTRRTIPPPPHAGRRRALSGDPDRHAPGPRQQPGDLQVGDRTWVSPPS